MFAGVVLGAVTSLGGGTVRDLIIRAPVFWLDDTNYLTVGIVAALVSFLASRWIRSTYALLLYATPILIGCLLYVMLRGAVADRTALLVCAVAVIFCIRASAIRWHIEIPGWLTSREDLQ